MRLRSGLVILSLSTVALAQQTDQATRDARRRFLEGLAAADRGNFEAARTAFQQTYAMKPTAAVRRNLGEAELRTGRYLAAARSISGYLAEVQDATDADRESARDSLSRAEEYVGKISVVVDDVTAAVLVDGSSVDWHRPIYVEPDQEHTVRADGGGRFESRTVSTPRGKHVTVELHLLPPVALAPTLALMPARVSVDAGPPAPPLGVSRGAPPGLVVAGGLAAAVSLGLGVAYAIKASSAEGDAQGLRSIARSQLGDPNSGSGPGCTYGAPVCSELDAALDSRSAARQIAVIGFVGAAVFGAATLGAIAFWPRREVALSAGVDWIGARGQF